MTRPPTTQLSVAVCCTGCVNDHEAVARFSTTQLSVAVCCTGCINDHKAVARFPTTQLSVYIAGKHHRQQWIKSASLCQQCALLTQQSVLSQEDIMSSATHYAYSIQQEFRSTSLPMAHISSTQLSAVYQDSIVNVVLYAVGGVALATTHRRATEQRAGI